MAKRITRERPLQSQYLCYYTLPMFQGAHGVFETGFFFFTTWRMKEPATRSGPVIAIIITPTDTDCAASKPSIYLELSLSLLAHERSQRAQTCPVPRKSRLFHRSFVTCSHSSTRWSITWHRQLPVSRRDTPMNMFPLFHSLLLSNVRAFLRRYERTAGRLGF